jgi:hypothetical protein
MKRADWRRGCDGSQESADGSSIFDDARGLVMSRNGQVTDWKAGIASCDSS